MYDPYVSSTLSLRCKGSPFSFNNYTYLLNDRFDGYPLPFSSSSLSCCACCANSTYRLPINSTIYPGLRQSNLIQWSAHRRLIWGGVDRWYSPLPVCDIDRKCCCERSYSIKERSVNNGRKGRWSKGRYGSVVSRAGGERDHLCVNDVEVMLSLLTEEVSEECFSVRERNGRSSRSVRVVERQNDTRNCCNKGKNKNVDSGVLESKSKSEHESVRFKSGEEDKKWKEDRKEEEREHFLKGENCRAMERKEGSRSSCSSYYSLSSGELESDSEDLVKNEGLVSSSSVFKKESKRAGEIRYDVKDIEEVEREGDYAKERGIVPKKENIAVGLYTESSGVKFDLRKTSEKQLTEVSTEQKNSKLQEVHESGSRKDSSFCSQYDGGEGKSTLAVNIDEGTRQHYRQTGNQVTGQSESKGKYKQFTEIAEIHGNVETMSSYKNGQSRREETLTSAVGLAKEMRGEHHTTAGCITRQDVLNRDSQQLVEVSEIKKLDTRGTSKSWQQCSESITKTLEDDSTKFTSSVVDKRELCRQASQQVAGQMDSSSKSHQLSEVSDMHDVVMERTSISRSSIIKMKKNEEKSITSMVHCSDFEALTNGQKFLEKKSNQERYSTTVLKPVEEPRERHTLTDKEVMQIGLMTASQGGIQQKASGTQESLVLPSSQLVVSDPCNVEPPSGFGMQEGLSESLEIDSGALRMPTQDGASALQHEADGGARTSGTYGEPLKFVSQEDALGSADRLHKSSTLYVDEFIEKANLQVSTSEHQKEKKTSELKLVYKDELHKKWGSGHSGSGDSQLTDHDSRRLSRVSVTRGPSDEMWDVADPSLQESSETGEVKDTTTTDNAVSKRTGKSLWNIISDIVQLRWASSSKTHKSISVLGRKSSPHQSTSSEAFYSGHEPDASSDENVKKERRTVLHESVPGDQQQLQRITDQSQGEGFSPMKSKDKAKHEGVDSPSSSSILESGSASKGVYLTSSEEKLGKNTEGTFSGAAIVESSFRPAVRLRKSSPVEEVSDSGRTDVSGSGSGSKDKDEQLSRGKFQRSKQVLKDSFDEWEEAYKLEIEQRKTDEMFMREALLEAKKAADMWEVPVGAVLVRDGKIIARGCNLVEELRDSTAHAEMICIREASNILRTWRLSETTLYVTLEPCPMCAGAILQARIDTVVWGAPNKLLGADGSWIRLFPNGSGGNGLEATDKPAAPVHPFHPKIIIRRGVLESECADAMQQFFHLRRRKKEKKPDPPPTPPSCLPIANHPSKILTKMHDAFHILFCL